MGTRPPFLGLARRVARHLTLLCIAVAPARATAQTFQGRVLDDQDDRPVMTALVRLVDTDGAARAVAAADSTGFYVLEAPEPGVYRIEAERLGYEGYSTPMLEARLPEGVYPIDLMLRRSPLPIRGLTVSTERADRQMRLMIGRDPRSLRVDPIEYEGIQASLDQGRSSLADVLRWSNTPGLLVLSTQDGPCFSVGGRRSCLRVYFDGLPYRSNIVDVLPLDMVYSILVVHPSESIMYPNGAVLLFSEAWLR